MKAIRRGAAGMQYSIMVGLVGMAAIAALTLTGGSVRLLQANVANRLQDATNGSVGAVAPAAPVAPPDLDPSGLAFTNLEDVATGSQPASAIIQPGSHDGVTVSVAGAAGGAFRVCADSGCASVLQDWGSAPATLPSGYWLQLRVTASASPATAVTLTVTAGTASTGWSVTTSSGCPSDRLCVGNTTHVVNYAGHSTRCAAWSGSVCTDAQVLVTGATCGSYAYAGQWHTNVYGNSSELRNCPNFCALSTRNASTTATVCETSSNGTVAGGYRACAMSTSTNCSSGVYTWMTSINYPGQNGNLHIYLGNCYSDYPKLRISCQGWSP